MKPVILLFGSPRSGTSWLGKIFDSHPGTLYRHEPDSVVVSDSIPLFVERDQRETHLDAARAYLDEVLRVRTPKVSAKLPLFPKSYLPSWKRRVRDGLVLVAKLGDRAGRTLDIPDLVDPWSDDVRVVWKSIESVGRLDLFARALPGSRSVHIVRHPCGTIASVLRGESLGGFVATTPASEDYGILELLMNTSPARRHGLTLDTMRLLAPVERLAWIWALSNELVMDATEGSDHCLTFRYEDLCATPVKSTRTLFDHCELTWDPQTEAFLSHSTSRDTERFHSVFKNPARSASKWQRQLDPADVDRILAITRKTKPGVIFS